MIMSKAWGLGLGHSPREGKSVKGRHKGGKGVCYTFIFVVCCHRERHYGDIRSTRKEGGEVIINHIYDAVREPT